MIKDTAFFSEFNDAQLREQPPDYEAALRLFEAMWEEALALGVLPLKDPLEGIDVDIRIARILNT